MESYFLMCNTRHFKNSLCLDITVYFIFIVHLWFAENVALRGKATQSTRLTDNPVSAAHNAIDGNRNSEFSVGSCTHTNEQTNPWWRVDLLQSYIITSVTIFNRGDCCQHRLSGLEIHIGNSLNNEGLENPKCVNRKEKQIISYTMILFSLIFAFLCL